MTHLRGTMFLSIAASAVLLWGCAGPQQLRGVGAAGRLSLAASGLVHVQVNEFTSSTQENVALDIAPDGRVFAAWDSRRQQEGQYGVYARVLDTNGNALSPEVEVNTHTRRTQIDPAVAATPEGGAWIVWTSFGQDGDAGSIVARRFDQNLSPLTNEIGINVERQGHQHDPAIAVGEDGRALIVWTSHDVRTDRSAIHGRIMNDDGSSATDPFTISEGEDASMLASVTATSTGYAVAWGVRRADGSSSVTARTLTQDGAPRAMIAVFANDGRDHIEPSIDADDAGGVVVAWLASSPSGHDVLAQRFDALGQPLIDAVIIESGGDWLGGVGVAAGADGRFMLAYNRARAGSDDIDLVVQRFDSAGLPSGEAEVIGGKGHQYLQFAKNARRIAWGGNGQLAIAWSGDAGGEDDSAVHVTLRAGDTRVAAARGSSARDQMRLAMNDTDAPIPPVWDPDFEPLPPLLIPPGPNGFEGIDFTGWHPPDPEVGVGPDRFVQMVNDMIAFFDRDGNLLFEATINEADGFFGEVGGTGFVFDPEALYDPHSGRFFAMACERQGGRSFYDFAVSDDSNPVGTWHKYRVDVTNVDTDIDSPNMAVDQNVLYLSADFFGPDKYQVLMIEKAPLLSGGAVNSRQIVITGPGEQSMGMPIIYDKNAPAGYLIQSSEGTGNGLEFNEVRFHGIRNQLTTPTRVTVDVSVPTYAYPVSPPQRGTTSRPFLFEPRFWSAMYVNGQMWAIHHIGPVRSRARWYQFDMNGWPESGDTPTLVQWGEIDPDPANNVHTYFPSIAADAQGNAAIVLARSSPNEFISMWGTFRRQSDPPGEFRPLTLIKESTSPYFGSRWGDYSHIEPEPGRTGSFWGTHEWTDVTSGWRTWIAPINAGASFATLVDLVILDGTLIAGGLPELEESDDDVLEVRARVTGEAHQTHLLRLLLGATSDTQSPASLDITVESRISEIQGTATLYLHNWNNDRFVQVGQFPVGTTESTRTIAVGNAARFVRSSDRRIELEVRDIVLLPIALQGFHAMFDQIAIGVN